MTGSERVMAAFLFSILGILSEGFCGALLWKWFAVPLGAIPISPTQFVGLALITSLLTYQYIPRDNEEHGAAAAFPFALAWLCLGIGALVRLFL